MTKREFLRALEEQLELPGGSLRETAVLAQVEGWDSMAALTFIALADEQFGVGISGNQVAKSRTVEDLLSLLGDRVAA